MHLPEGSLNSSAVLVTTAVGMVAFGIACYCARGKLCPKQLPSLFAMTIFVLLAQMVNYATGFGYSGHWVGAGLLAIFFGPIAATLKEQEFDSVELLYNYPEDQVKPYLTWLKK